MTTEDHHFRREDRALHWRRIATHIEAHPSDLAIALANIDRWLARGRVHPAPLLEWRTRILEARRSPGAMSQFIGFLAAPNHDAEPLKSCSPFVDLPLSAPSNSPA